MKRNLVTAVLMTIATTVLLGIIYPLVVTGLAHIFFSYKANGQLIERGGTVIGSRIIGQPFSAPEYFYGRPSAAGSGYDAANSNGSQLGPTNHKLIDRVEKDVAALRAENVEKDLATLQAQNSGKAIPIDLVTASASGLDPHITPAAAEFQVARVARERGMAESAVRLLVAKHTEGHQLGFLGEPRVNVLELNLELDAVHPLAKTTSAELQRKQTPP